MNSQKNILIAFLLNFFFALFEFVGGIITGSIAIISDSIHDIGDSLGIGFSYFLEVKSKKAPDKTHTYGYARYSVFGAFTTNIILLFGSIITISAAVYRIFNPQEINYNGMMIFAVVGVIINAVAAKKTLSSDNMNSRAVSLHMLEDVLGWAVVLIGSIIMRFTDITILDPIMSIGVSVFILINAFLGLREIFDLFLIKIPDGINIDDIAKKVLAVSGVLDAHHIHIWSISGEEAYATMHIVTDGQTPDVKNKVRARLKEEGIVHLTLETELPGEVCEQKNCEPSSDCAHHHHHHHH